MRLLHSLSHFDEIRRSKWTEWRGNDNHLKQKEPLKQAAPNAKRAEQL